jgi:hypothetical protein
MSLFEKLPVGMLVVNDSDQIVHFNDQIKTLMGDRNFSKN